jgi:cell division protein FtsI/penicillin-binding protein 2
MVRIQERIKYHNLLKYFIDFGLSEETGIDLPNEISQNISSLNYKIPINYATAAFGQGVSFSPIATIRALSVIASDGFLVRPHIISEIDYNNKNIASEIIDIEKKRVLNLESVSEIQRIMVAAVNQTPSKLKYKPKYYSVAAKTGTAQVASKYGGYKQGVNIHTFFGFFPVKATPENRYSIILYTFEPKAKYSSQTLTKPFFDILKFLIHYYDIKPDLIK